MDTIEIRYNFSFDGQRLEIVHVVLDARNLTVVRDIETDLPDWTRLAFHQCPHCPLDNSVHAACPVAAVLVDIVRRFDKIVSYDPVDLEIITAERTTILHTTAQRGISSLIGLLFPASGCPHTAFFRPMVRFHLPMANKQETLFRAAGMYLLAQFFLGKDGRTEDSELVGLTQIYKNLNVLNIHIAERLRNATQTDSSLNAIIILDVFTQALPFVIDDHLEEMRHLFEPYLSDFYTTIMKATEE